MRNALAADVEAGRVLRGPFGTEPGARDGAFFVTGPMGRVLQIIASSGDDWDACRLSGEPWEHVSVSLAEQPSKTPTWAEMDWVRLQWWDPSECVVQFHPPESVKVNFFEGCLHLWRPTKTAIPLPPTICV